MSSSALREVEAIGCLSGWLGQVIPSGVRAFIGKSFLRECVPPEFGWTAALLGHHSIPGAVNGKPSTTEPLPGAQTPLVHRPSRQEQVTDPDFAMPAATRSVALPLQQQQPGEGDAVHAGAPWTCVAPSIQRGQPTETRCPSSISATSTHHRQQ